MSDSLLLVSPQTFRLAESSDPLFTLESGQTLEQVEVRFETYGTLSPARDNAVLLLHAFSGDAHAAGVHSPEDAYPGWWDSMVGPGKAFDTQRYFLVCSNVLGGCMGTTGPSSLDPRTGKPYGMDFPILTIRDMVRLQKRLMDHLGIPQWLAVAGGSMGGMQSLDWSVAFPEAQRGCIVLASTPRLTPQGIAFNAVGRNAIMSDPHWHNGQYYGKAVPATGLSIARMVGHITYLSDESMRQKFGRRVKEGKEGFHLTDQFEVEGYLRYQGQKFVDRFDANSYIYLSRAMDYFDLGKDEGGLDQAARRAVCRHLLVSFTSDWLFPTYQTREWVNALLRAGRSVSFVELKSPYGHDSFLIDVEEQTTLVRGFLGGLHG